MAESLFKLDFGADPKGLAPTSTTEVKPLGSQLAGPDQGISRTLDFGTSDAPVTDEREIFTPQEDEDLFVLDPNWRVQTRKLLGTHSGLQPAALENFSAFGKNSIAALQGAADALADLFSAPLLTEEEYGGLARTFNFSDEASPPEIVLKRLNRVLVSGPMQAGEIVLRAAAAVFVAPLGAMAAVAENIKDEAGLPSAWAARFVRDMHGWIAAGMGAQSLMGAVGPRVVTNQRQLMKGIERIIEESVATLPEGMQASVRTELRNAARQGGDLAEIVTRAEEVQIAKRAGPNAVPPGQILDGRMADSLRAQNAADNLIASIENNATTRFNLLKGADETQLAERAAEAYRTTLDKMTFETLTADEKGIKVAQFKQRMKKENAYEAKTPSGEAIRDRSNRERKEIDDQRKTFSLKTLRRIRNKLVHNIVDRSGNIKRELEQAGPLGREAVMRLELVQGAGQRAILHFQNAQDRIYKGLNKSDRRHLDDMIQFRTLMNVLIRRPEHFTGPKIKDKVTGKERDPNIQDYNAALGNMKIELGETKYRQIWSRADHFYKETRNLVTALEEEGIITASEAVKLRNWEYSPMRYLDEIDPKMEIKPHRRGAISVRGSGIKGLEKGDRLILEKDSEFLLAELMGRVWSFISRNNATKALRNLALKHPNNGVVTANGRVGNKLRWRQISAMEGGKERKIWLNEELYPEWSATPIDYNQAVGWVSGVNLLKPMATGINPGFILTNVPRELAYIWYTTNEFSTLLPAAMVQMARNLAIVLPDAIKRGPKTQAYINEGGGMSMLTHQGRVGMNPDAILPHVSGPIKKHVERWFHILGYLNETAELSTRLMLRDQAIRNGASPINATHAARRYIDFAQGGLKTKQLEAMFPYLNAGVQGMRGYARYARNDPQKWFLKMGQLQVAYASQYLESRAHPSFPDIPQHVKDTNMVYTTPYYYDDRAGRHYLYYKVPIDHNTIWLKIMTDMLMARWFEDKIPDDRVIETLKKTFGIVPGASVPPMASTIFGYASNYSWWRNDDMWRGPDIPASQEFRELPNTPTSPLAVDIANEWKAVTGFEVSPTRMTGAIQETIPKNIYTGSVGTAYALATRDMKDTGIGNSTEEMLTRSPFLRRYLGRTHPFNRVQETVDEITEERSGEVFIQNRDLDRMIHEHLTDSFETPRSDLRTWVRNQPKQDQDRLQRRIDRTIEFERIFDRADVVNTVRAAPKIWWIRLSGMDQQARIQNFVEEWRDANDDPDFSKQRVALMRQVVKRVPGFKEKDFRLELRRAIAQQELPNL